MERVIVLLIVLTTFYACKNETSEPAPASETTSDFRDGIQSNGVEVNPYLNKEQDIKNNEGKVTRKVRFLPDGRKSVTDYYKGGDTVYLVRYFKNDLQDGKTIGYHPNGKIREIQFFNMGKQFGQDSIFYETGELWYIYSFENDKKNGWMYRYSKDGKQEFAANYKDDKVIEVIDNLKPNKKK